MLDQLPSIRQGSVVVLLRDADATELGLPLETDLNAAGGVIASAPVAVSCWRGRANLTVMVSGAEGEGIKERIETAQE